MNDWNVGDKYHTADGMAVMITRVLEKEVEVLAEDMTTHRFDNNGSSICGHTHGPLARRITGTIFDRGVM